MRISLVHIPVKYTFFFILFFSIIILFLFIALKSGNKNLFLSSFSIFNDVFMNKKLSLTDQDALVDAKRSLSTMLYDFLTQHGYVLNSLYTFIASLFPFYWLFFFFTYPFLFLPSISFVFLLIFLLYLFSL